MECEGNAMGLIIEWRRIATSGGGGPCHVRIYRGMCGGVFVILRSVSGCKDPAASSQRYQSPSSSDNGTLRVIW